jgi:uncharacterized alpha-E superfamily protein
MYRRRHHRITPERVVEFLLMDPTFPRSVHHCLLNAEESLHAITGTSAGTFDGAAEQRLGQLRSELTFLPIEDVIRSGLHEFVDAFQVRLNLAGDAIREAFFPDPTPDAVPRPASRVGA